MRGAKATRFLELDNLQINESMTIESVKRTSIRDAIRRHKDRSYMTRQVNDDVVVVRIK